MPSARFVLIQVVASLLLAVPTALLFAGEESTLAPRPPTADEVAAKVLAPAPCDAVLVEKTLADATPAFLRATIAAIRERAAKAAAAPAPVVIEAPKDAATAVAPPDLPVPESVARTGRGVGFEVRFLDMPREAARTLLGGEPGGAKPIVRSATAPEVAELLRAVESDPTLEVITSARFMTYDGQKGLVTVLTKVAYVDDYEVKEGMASPMVQHETEGLEMEVRPVLSADGKTMRLELSTRDRRVVVPPVVVAQDTLMVRTGVEITSQRHRPPCVRLGLLRGQQHLAEFNGAIAPRRVRRGALQFEERIHRGRGQFSARRRQFA